jgi:hypothetical protein
MERSTDLVVARRCTPLSPCLCSQRRGENCGRHRASRVIPTAGHTSMYANSVEAYKWKWYSDRLDNLMSVELIHLLGRITKFDAINPHGKLSRGNGIDLCSYFRTLSSNHHSHDLHRLVFTTALTLHVKSIASEPLPRTRLH